VAGAGSANGRGSAWRSAVERVAIRAALATAALLAATACGEAPAAESPARTTFERLAADSAHADSAAFAALPPALAPVLDIRGEMDPAAWPAFLLAECLDLTPRRAGEVRRRLQLRLPDTTAIVLFAVGDTASGALERVEFVRRMPRNGQRGLTWDGARDRTISLWWTETAERGISRRAERGTVPRGSATPRALRGLGRALLARECPEEGAATRTPR
jgi:hypothetical protein